VADMHWRQAASVDRRRTQTSCGRRRRETGRHGAWLTRRAGTSRPDRRMGGQTCKPTAKIEPKSLVARFWLVQCILHDFIELSILLQCNYLIFIIINDAATKHPIEMPRRFQSLVCNICLISLLKCFA